MANKNLTPIIISVIIHVAIIGILVWNFNWFDSEQQSTQYVDAPVQAKLVTAPVRPKPDANKPKPRPQPPKEQPKEQPKEEPNKEAEQQKQLEREQEIAREKEIEKQQEAEKLKQQEQKRLELEKQKQEQQKKEQLEKEKQEKERLAEEKRKQEEAEKKRKAEEDRKRKEREEAERKRQQEIKRLEQEMAAQEDEFFEAELDSVRQGQILSEVEKIKILIAAKIIRNWDLPAHEGRCVIKIKTAPGGVVLDTQAISGDSEYCRTGEIAINRADPLPSSDNPKVADELREIEFTFDPSKKNR
ncbi:MAG: cell envelope integrity protein TolA [Kangiellaceae bacterium]|nr:cell envelope integrity protein TolA [Kangiellaceae bacterium]